MDDRFAWMRDDGKARGRMSDVRRQRAEVRPKGTEVGGRKARAELRGTTDERRGMKSGRWAEGLATMEDRFAWMRDENKSSY